KVRFCSRATYRFYILYNRRGIRFCRKCIVDGHLFPIADAHYYNSGAAAKCFQSMLCIRSSVHYFLSSGNKYLYDNRPRARNRYSSAIYKLWRYISYNIYCIVIYSYQTGCRQANGAEITSEKLYENNTVTGREFYYR